MKLETATTLIQLGLWAQATGGLIMLLSSGARLYFFARVQSLLAGQGQPLRPERFPWWDLITGFFGLCFLTSAGLLLWRLTKNK